MHQKVLPGLPPPDAPKPERDPLLELRAAVDRLADIHRRQDAIGGVPR